MLSHVSNCGRSQKQSGPEASPAHFKLHDMSKLKSQNRIESIGGDVPTNGAADLIALNEPYTVRVTIRGVAPLIMHRYNCEAVAEQAKGAKGSKVRKTDNLESYVYRLENGNLGVPGIYFRAAIAGAAKYMQDPRSPRKSAVDLVKAGVIAVTELADLGTLDWHYIDTRGHNVQRAKITRQCPAMRIGWILTFDLAVLVPEYIGHEMLHSLVDRAGKLCGLGEIRPTYGRFQIVGFEEVRLS
jgi:hypothetical protein